MTLRQRLRALLAALVIDGLDLATSGPLGLFSGALLGGIVGYWLAPELGFPPRRRLVAALLTAVYCMLPMTGLVPLATVVAGLVQLLEPPPPAR